LFFARLLQKLFCRGKKTDSQAGIGMWRFGKKHFLTVMVYAILNIDFCLCSIFAKAGIHLPGLSLLAVCKKQ